jgi:hypothetical protein
VAATAARDAFAVDPPAMPVLFDGAIFQLGLRK